MPRICRQSVAIGAAGRENRRWPERPALNLLQLLQTARHADFRRHLGVRKAGLPVGDADLAEIDVAFGIQRNAVGGEEFAGLDPRAVLAAEPGDALALGI